MDDELKKKADDALKNKASEILSCLVTHNPSKIWEYETIDILQDHIAITFAADTKLIFTAKENEVIKRICEICLSHNGTSNQLRISLTFIYVHLPQNENPLMDKYAIIPIIKCLKNASDEGCLYLDHNGNSYVSWDEFKTNNDWKGCVLYFPMEGNSEDVILQSKDVSSLVGKVFNKKLHKFQIDKTILQSSQSLELLKNELASPEVRKIKEIVRVSCFKNILVNETKDFINFIRDKFRDRAIILERLLNGFQTITGKTREYLGNFYFVRNIIGILNCITELTKMEVTDENQLLLSTGLKLDAKAFIQVKGKWLSYLLFSESPYDRELKKILGVYRYTLESQRVEFKEKICKALNVDDIKLFCLNKTPIFSDLKPFEIDRIYSVMTNTCHDFDSLFIKLGIKFAELMRCENVTEFCAALEYVALHLDKSIWRDMKKIIKSSNKERLEAFREEKWNEFNLENLQIDLQNLIQIYNGYCKENGLNFTCAMSAAYHYEKHKKIKKKKKVLNFKEYLDMAKTIASRDVTFKWSQDGSSKCFEIFDEETFGTAIKYQKPDGSTVIATLIFRDKMPPKMS